MPTNLLYMNQGGNGNWGGLDYGNYNILCLAECSVLKKGFTTSYDSETNPRMIVQAEDSVRRIISAPVDLDITVQEVRPMVVFQIVGTAIRVVFFHLKSANANQATNALGSAIAEYKKKYQNLLTSPTLWIGDYNRADHSSLENELGSFKVLKQGGGISQWKLDRAIITGDWKNEPTATVASTSGDNQHIAIAVSIN